MEFPRLILLALLGLLTACSNVNDKYIEYKIEPPTEFAVLKATGYAPISSQQGVNDTAKILNAMQASKLAAYRELSEQVHGQQVAGQSSFNDLIVGNSSFKSSVQGLIRGAKVVQTYPVNEDIYATELELDFEVVYQLYLSSLPPRRVIKQ